MGVRAEGMGRGMRGSREEGQGMEGWRMRVEE